MKELEPSEISSVNGGFTFLPFLIGSAINLAVYALSKHRKNEEMTVEGACISAATGALTGGIGGMCVKAAGGGIAANVAWRPGMIGVNTAGQQIAQEY